MAAASARQRTEQGEQHQQCTNSRGGRQSEVTGCPGSAMRSGEVVGGLIHGRRRHRARGSASRKSRIAMGVAGRGRMRC